jgi:hypothetical protein
MTYVFVFIGEFGYELFNWQGVIRKWASENKKDGDTVVVCSRKGLNLIYEDICDNYIDISELPSFKSVVADCYTSYIFTNSTNCYLPRNQWRISRVGRHIDDIKNEVTSLVKSKLDIDNAEYIWSCDYTVKNGYHFGLERPGGRGGIYNHVQNKLDLNNNHYVKFNYDTTKTQTIQNRLGFSINDDYVLCQTAFRVGYDNCKVKIDYRKVLNSLVKNDKVVLVDFNTNRLNDSYSNFENSKHTVIQVNDIREQSVLIHHAKRCIFLSEGTLRSHTYLPPMFGKDVEIVSSNYIFNTKQSPIEFWNENVFLFGGKMIKNIYEELIK